MHASDGSSVYVDNMKNSICGLLMLFCLQCSFAGSDQTYGDAEVKEVISVYDGDTFIVNIMGYPPIVGTRIPIRVAGVDTPEIRGTTGYTKELSEKARKFTSYKLLNAKKIVLKNLRRDKYFRILADVYVDGVNLAQELIRVGLGKNYDGGPRPTW